MKINKNISKLLLAITIFAISVVGISVEAIASDNTDKNQNLKVISEYIDSNEPISTEVIEETDNSYKVKEMYENGTEVESGFYEISKPQALSGTTSGGSWSSGTCYRRVKGLYVYKYVKPTDMPYTHKFQFTADVTQIDPSCNGQDEITNGYDIMLDGSLNGRFTVRRKNQYTAVSKSGAFDLTLYAENGQLRVR